MPLNQILVSRINGREIRALYTMGIQCDSYSIRNAVRSAVSSVRRSIRDTSEDTLATRAVNYPNGTGAYARDLIRTLSAELFRSKAPNTGTIGNWVSIEFECIFRTEMDLNAFCAGVRKAKLSSVTTVKTDGSVRRDDSDMTGVCREIVFS